MNLAFTSDMVACMNTQDATDFPWNTIEDDEHRWTTTRSYVSIYVHMVSLKIRYLMKPQNPLVYDHGYYFGFISVISYVRSCYGIVYIYIYTYVFIYLFIYLIASGKPAGHSHLLPFSLAVVSGGPKGSWCALYEYCPQQVPCLSLWLDSVKASCVWKLLFVKASLCKSLLGVKACCA